MISPHATLRHGLIGAWCPSLAGSGFLLPDRSGLNYHGTLTNTQGGSNWVPLGSGQTLTFDGSNDFASTPTIKFGGSWYASLSMWIRYTNSTAGTAIIFEHSDNYNNRSALVLLLTATNVIYVAMGTGAAKYSLASFTRQSSNRWHHLTAVYDRTLAPDISATRLYIDGVQQTGTQPSGTTYAAATDGFADFPCYIGSRSGGTLALAGAVDDVRLYNRVLLQSEINLLASRRGIGLVPQRTRRAQTLGSQFWLRDAGTWKKATGWIKVGGVWTKATPKINVSGTWK